MKADSSFQDFVKITYNDEKLFKRARLLNKKGVVAFGFTDTFQVRMMHEFNRNIKNNMAVMRSACARLLDYMELLHKLPKGPNRAKEAHRLIDASMAKEAKLDLPGEEPVCRKNCSMCCHIQPYATDSEIDLIVPYVQSRGITIDMDRLAKQAVHDNSHDYLGKLAWEDQLCVFVNAEGGCGIYPVRPATCRKHLMSRSNVFCDPRSYETAPLVVRDEAELIASALLNLESDPIKEINSPLPMLFHKKFK